MSLESFTSGWKAEAEVESIQEVMGKRERKIVQELHDFIGRFYISSGNHVT